MPCKAVSDARQQRCTPPGLAWRPVSLLDRLTAKVAKRHHGSRREARLRSMMVQLSVPSPMMLGFSTV